MNDRDGDNNIEIGRYSEEELIKQPPSTVGHNQNLPIQIYYI